MTTSKSAGSPFFTTASARLIAGPRSLGLEIGPSTHISPCLGRSSPKIQIGILELRADARPVDAAVVPRRHALHVHDLLVIGAVVVHDREHRDLMVRGRPERSRNKHQIPVVLLVDK